jgi:predicted nuclease of predicted toxin-antitoxin system
VKFLIDECLAKSLTRLAHAAGYEAYHVVERGLAGLADYELKRIIEREEFTFVTNNAQDFLRIYEGMRLHAGLIILRPNVWRDQQRKLLSLALKEVNRSRLLDLINKVVEVDFADGVRIYDLPESR